TADAGASSAECLTEFDSLVPLQKYENGDLYRAILVDGAQVFFRNMKDVFRIPLAGGTPTAISKAPALALDGRTVLWMWAHRLRPQSHHEPTLMASPKAGGAWTTIIDLTKEKLGGGRTAASRILHDIGKGGASSTTRQAVFDGTSFYWTEEKS